MTTTITHFINGAETAGEGDRTQPVYNPATGRQQIAFQKWISLFNQGTEAYAEWRRSGQPVLTPGPGAIIDVVPRRLTGSFAVIARGRTPAPRAARRYGYPLR